LEVFGLPSEVVGDLLVTGDGGNGFADFTGDVDLTLTSFGIGELGIDVPRARVAGSTFVAGGRDSTSSSCKAVSIALRTCEDVEEEVITEDAASSMPIAEFGEGRKAG
jgi:hypothetical protein